MAETLGNWDRNSEGIIICEEWEEGISKVFCEDCEQHMCADCNKKIHNKGKRAKHIRKEHFSNEAYEDIKLKDQSMITDDIWVTQSINENELKSLNAVENQEKKNIMPSSNKNSSMTTESTSFKRSISGGWRSKKSLPPTHSNPGALLSLKNARAFIPIDKRKFASSYYPQISNFPNAAVNKSLNNSGPKYKNRNLRPNSSSSMGSTTSSVDYTPYYDGSSSMNIPLYQPYVKVEKKVPQKLHTQIFEIQQVLRSKAAEGQLMIESKELSELTGQGQELFEQCEQYGIIHNTERQFGNYRQVFYSLKMEIISLESIIWCLRSLKIDEMTPTEKAIQSRVKEAFNYKVNSRLWDKILEGVKIHSKLSWGQHNHAVSNPQGWSSFSKQYKNYRYQHSHGSEDYDAESLKVYGPLSSNYSRNSWMPKMGGSLRRVNSFRKYNTTRSGNKLYHLNTDLETEKISFELEEDISNIDPNSSWIEVKTYLIYPEGDKWNGVDGKANSVDSELYQEFVNFLEEYFTSELEEFWEKYGFPTTLSEDNKNNHRIPKTQKQRSSVESNEMNPIGMHAAAYDENTRAIPGGRYGWAQFVKSWGPPILRQLSLGMFSQMIQKAITEDLLRYQKKTLLVWTASIDKDITWGLYTQEEIIMKREEIIKKLAAVKMAIIDTLLKHPDGISLAQLPNHLKTRLNFSLNLAELGFAKLKDLILSMRDRVEVSNSNHPVATLAKPKGNTHSTNSSEDMSIYAPYPPGYYPMNYYYNEAMNPQRMSYQTEGDYQFIPYPGPPYFNAQYQNYLSNYNSNGKVNVSFGSFYSQTERHNFKLRNHSSDVKNLSVGSVYIPHASSLYGSVWNTSIPAQGKTNIGHYRNNTGGSDHDGEPTISVPHHKQANYSHDMPLQTSLLKYSSNQENENNNSQVFNNGGGNNYQNPMQSHESLDMSSSAFYSKNVANEIRSRSASPSHNRIVSNLNELGFSNEGFVNPIKNQIVEENRISEERKSDEETGHSGSLQAMEELLAPILSDSKKSENSVRKWEFISRSDTKKLNSGSNPFSSTLKKFKSGFNKTQTITLSSTPGHHLKANSDDFGKPVPKPSCPQIGYFGTKKLVKEEEVNKLMSKKDIVLQEIMQNQ